MAFYLRPPGGNIPLQKLQSYAETRFNFLSQVFDTKGDRMKLFDILKDSNNVAESECLIEGTVKDVVSHFILRLCCLEDKSMREFFISAETLLFDFRFSSMSEEELYKTFRSLNTFLFNIDPEDTIEDNISKYMYGSVTDILRVFSLVKGKGWKITVHKYLKGISESYFKVPFQSVLNLVSTRSVGLLNGMAYVPYCKLREVVTGLFSDMLRISMMETKDCQMRVKADERLTHILRKVKWLFGQKYRSAVAPIFVPWTLTHCDVDGVASLFPPCMSSLHRILKQRHRLKHNARIQYTLFLKEAGLPAHEALMFWRKEYSQEATNKDGCCHDWASDEKRYTYNIRHLYGLEGSRINYRGHCCASLQEVTCGPSDVGGCPFSHFDPAHLVELLALEGVTVTDEQENILQLASEGKYNQACGQTLQGKLRNLQRKTGGSTKERKGEESKSLNVDSEIHSSCCKANDYNCLSYSNINWSRYISSKQIVNCRNGMKFNKLDSTESHNLDDVVCEMCSFSVCQSIKEQKNIPTKAHTSRCNSCIRNKEQKRRYEDQKRGSSEPQNYNSSVIVKGTETNSGTYFGWFACINEKACCEKLRDGLPDVKRRKIFKESSSVKSRLQVLEVSNKGLEEDNSENRRPKLVDSSASGKEFRERKSGILRSQVFETIPKRGALEGRNSDNLRPHLIEKSATCHRCISDVKETTVSQVENSPSHRMSFSKETVSDTHSVLLNQANESEINEPLVGDIKSGSLCIKETEALLEIAEKIVINKPVDFYVSYKKLVDSLRDVS